MLDDALARPEPGNHERAALLVGSGQAPGTRLLVRSCRPSDLEALEANIPSPGRSQLHWKRSHRTWIGDDGTAMREEEVLHVLVKPLS